MATGVKRQQTKGGLYQAYFTDYTGKRRYFTAPTRSEAKLEAKRLESEHRLIRQGIKPIPSTTEKHSKRPFAEVKDEYMAWGEAQGGREGKPWAEWHAHKRRTHLAWWQEHLGLEALGDLHGVLPRVEKELRALQREGRAGKTLANYAEALAAFCDWCKQRGYLSEDPLAGMAAFDTSPRIRRRALTADEIGRVLEHCAPHRRLFLETAFASGLRLNELRNLTVDHLDRDRGGLHLDAAWTKNRKSGFQPLPNSLVQRLHAYATSGEAKDLYERYLNRKDSKRKIPPNPLLYIPSSASRDLAKDLEAAGIPKEAAGGKVDFHACRVSYISLVVESGVSAKEAQELARHATPDLTMNVYARTREDRLSAAVEQIGTAMTPLERVPEEYRQAVGAEIENATLYSNEGCVEKEMVELRGIEPLTS